MELERDGLVGTGMALAEQVNQGPVRLVQVASRGGGSVVSNHLSSVLPHAISVQPTPLWGVYEARHSRSRTDLATRRAR